ncbi:hypothetical protein J6590_015258 [Homalodisca vitripennis]|nr:hypothetical protein J6590_015258 [Homalodisca vitripennis]
MFSYIELYDWRQVRAVTDGSGDSCDMSGVTVNILSCDSRRYNQLVAHTSTI